MPGRLVHFEVPASDSKRAMRFYGDLFGWEFQGWEGGPIEYNMTRAGGDPGGAIYPSEHAGGGLLVYFDVDDIRAATGRVGEVGGEAGEVVAIPGVGYSAFCRDSEGNRFGLYQDDPSAAGPDA